MIVLLPHAAQMPCRCKACPFCDGLHVQTTIGENISGQIDPHQVDVVDHAETGMVAKETREVPFAQCSNIGQPFKRPVLRRLGHDTVLDPVNGGMDVVAARQPGGDLRVVAAAPEINHHGLGNARRDGRRCHPGDYMQHQVDTGGNAGARETPAILHKKTIFRHLRQGRDASQAFDTIGMGRAGSPVEKPRLTRQQGTGADGDNGRVGTHRRMKPGCQGPPLPSRLRIIVEAGCAAGDQKESVFRQRRRQGLQCGKLKADGGLLFVPCGDVPTLKVDILLVCIGVTNHLQWTGNVQQKRMRRHERKKRNNARVALIHQAASFIVASTSSTPTIRAKRPASTSSVR
ncbi:hypothetical protein AT6N2_C2360 [Agrobacterium tumefaciens]|nr:hypothetical protein AT6N2_C2360 [Agrobacterium tumefaciens]